MPADKPPEPQSGANLSGDEVNVGGDVAGRDKIVSTTTSTSTHTTTTNVEGGPVARYAVVGIIVIALAAILAIALSIPRPPVVTATPTLTASSTPEPSLTPAPVPSATPAAPTATATETAAPPTATPTPPPPTETATLPPPTETATATLPPGVTATPTSAVPVYDAFDDRCVNADRWAQQAMTSGAALRAPAADEATPEATATATPQPPRCLPVEEQFFTEGADGRLTVFVGVEAGGTESLIQAPPGCFREAEVVLALAEAEILSGGREVYLAVGASLRRRTGDAVLEVRVRAYNYTGRTEIDLRPRLIVPDGTLDLNPIPYTLGRPVTVALRTRDIGAAPVEGAASTNKILTMYVDGQPLSPSFSIIADPCSLTLGYHAEAQTALFGYFDEVRLNPVPE